MDKLSLAIAIIAGIIIVSVIVILIEVKKAPVIEDEEMTLD